MSQESVNQPRVGIGVFVFKDGKFLMGRRKGSHDAGTWSIPGGHLEFGETPERTAVREVKEETGMEVGNVRFGAVTNDIFVNDNKHYVSIWVVTDWLSGEPTITEPDKYIDQRWVDFDTLPEPLFLAWRQLLESEFYDNLKAGLKQSEGVDEQV